MARFRFVVYLVLLLASFALAQSDPQAQRSLRLTRGNAINYLTLTGDGPYRFLPSTAVELRDQDLSKGARR